MGKVMRFEVGKGDAAVARCNVRRVPLLLLAAAWGCSDGTDETTLLLVEPPPQGASEVRAFLGLPLTAAEYIGVTP